MKAVLIFFISIVFLFLLGCDKNEDNVFLEGNIVGFVNLIDESGEELIDKSGVNISAENTSYSAITDKAGRFELKNITAGTYNLLYDKDGFGTYKTFGYQFIGGNLPALTYGVTLYEQPEIEIQSLDVSFNDSLIQISGTITTTSEYSIQFFLSDSSNVSNTNYDYSTGYSSQYMATNQFSGGVYLSETPFFIGGKVYLVIYFKNIYANWGYYDYEKEEYVQTSCKKASNIIEIILD